MNKYSTLNEINNLIYEVKNFKRNVSKEFEIFVEKLNQIPLLCNDPADKSKVMKLFEKQVQIKIFVKH